MGRAVLAHHVFAHKRGHQSARLFGAEHLNALFLTKDIVTAGEQGRIKLWHIGDWRVATHFGERWIGVDPEGLRVDVKDRCVGHSVCCVGFEVWSSHELGQFFG